LGQDAWVFSLHLQAFPRIASCAWRLTVDSWSTATPSSISLDSRSFSVLRSLC
jgi:hypothetical protein